MGRLELNLWWEPRDPSQAEDAPRLSDFVTRLPEFDPIYQSWLNSPTRGNGSPPLERSRGDTAFDRQYGSL
jgi:hypothetical protein